MFIKTIVALNEQLYKIICSPLIFTSFSNIPQKVHPPIISNRKSACDQKNHRGPNKSNYSLKYRALEIFIGQFLLAKTASYTFLQ